MIKENIYVAINHNGENQWVKGSSSKTKCFSIDLSQGNDLCAFTFLFLLPDGTFGKLLERK